MPLRRRFGEGCRGRTLTTAGTRTFFAPETRPPPCRRRCSLAHAQQSHLTRAPPSCPRRRSARLTKMQGRQRALWSGARSLIARPSTPPPCLFVACSVGCLGCSVVCHMQCSKPRPANWHVIRHARTHTQAHVIVSHARSHKTERPSGARSTTLAGKPSRHIAEPVGAALPQPEADGGQIGAGGCSGAARCWKRASGEGPLAVVRSGDHADAPPVPQAPLRL